MTAEWTFMVYLAGDNDLSAAGDEDLKEMRRVGSTPAVNVVAEFDNAGDQGTRRFHLQPSGQDERVENVDETDSGSPATLLDFVDWAVTHYPAKRYALVLWNHGGGWEPTESERTHLFDAANLRLGDSIQRSSSSVGGIFFRTSAERILSLPTPVERAICLDDGSGHSLDTVELGTVLGRVTERLGQPLDLLGMDACLMSTLEVAYEIREHARYLVASEENAPNEGWPYDRVLGRLTAEPGISTADLARGIVDETVGWYKDRGHSGDVTQSAFDLFCVTGLAGPLNSLAEALISHMPKAGAEIWKSQRRSVSFHHQTLWDVNQFCEELSSRTSDEAVRRAADDVRTALVPGTGRPLSAEARHGPKVERCGGVSLYLLPPAGKDISRFYSELAWARDSRWLEMLEAYHAAV